MAKLYSVVSWLRVFEDDPPSLTLARQGRNGMLKIAIAFEPGFARFLGLSGESGEKPVLNRSRVRVGLPPKRSNAGHNNTEINPVFRGMSHGGLPAILTKGKL
jgi:hypothetical protein